MTYGLVQHMTVEESTCLQWVKQEAALYIIEKKLTHCCLTLLHSERPKLYTILAFLSAIRLKIIDALGHLGSLCVFC